MTVLRWIASVLQIVAGVFFLLNIASDIQLGAGLILLTQGIVNLPR